MKLNTMQKRKVEENVGLVHKVIADKVHGPFPIGIYTREDLFQIGCIGLCKAAATDKGGRFSTYAYRLIWNEICDVLIRSSREKKIVTEDLFKDILFLPDSKNMEIRLDLRLDLGTALSEAEKAATPSAGKGIRSLILMQKGYTCKEIGLQMGVEANHVSAWVSKARKFLKGKKKILELAGEYGYGKD